SVRSGDLVDFSTKDGPVKMDAATAVFRHGPDFVDVATGKNPLFTCAVCGIETLEDTISLALPRRIETPPFVDDNGNRLCFADWLANHPQYMVAVGSKGAEYRAITEKAQAIIAQRTAVKSAPVRSTPPTEE